MEISQEQAQEYREVAALMCEDIELLVEVVSFDPNMSAESIRKHINHLKEAKDEAISNPKARSHRFNSMQMIYDALATGQIRCDTVNPDGTIVREK